MCRVEETAKFDGLREFFEEDNPGLRLDRVEATGESRLRSEGGGMRVFWIYRGHGEVFLPRGYRTKEGDGSPLPDVYRPDAIDPAFADLLDAIEAGLPKLSAAAASPVQGILSRRKNGEYFGECLGELWNLDHLPRPWSLDDRVEKALCELYRTYRDHGYSTKESDSWEPVIPGDQIAVCGEEEIRVRGDLQFLAMENLNCPVRHVSSVRRLRHLADTAGGCNPDFDPFRRLPLTWHYNDPRESGDGVNWVNSHVVNIPRETSPTHFHPPKGIGRCGGIPQREMYLTLDPASYRLNTWGRKASLLVFPDLRNLWNFEQHPLEPGMFIYIPPGTGHRGMDVFVNVLTIPGFKPHNEYYLDRAIFDATSGDSPYNANLSDKKNFDDLEVLL
jgi:hypothetical protein